MCEYVQVPCVHSRCGELVTRANLVEHLEKSCQFRMEKCDHCQTLVEFAFLEVRITMDNRKIQSFYYPWNNSTEIGCLPLSCRHLEQDPLSNLILNVLLHLPLQQYISDAD